MNTEKENLLSDRIRECAKLIGSGDELARRCQLSRRTLENYLTGKSEPKVGNITTISEVSGVSLEWLLRGEGPMMRDHLLAGENEEGEATSALAHACVAVYSSLHKAGKMISPEKFEELSIAMWEVDRAYGDNMAEDPADPLVQKMQKLISTALKPE